MDNMNAEDREGVLQAYTSRKEAEANASTSEESDNRCDDGDRATNFTSNGCSAGTGCLDPTSTTMASLCEHKSIEIPGISIAKNSPALAA